MKKFIILFVLISFCAFGKAQEQVNNSIKKKSIQEKLENKIPVTIGFIGGSITEGAKADGFQKRYPNRLIELLKEKYQYNSIQLINAGIGATGSEIASYRVKNDLLKYKPDLVFIDFSVNDPNNLRTIETYEGLVRQILEVSDVISLIFPLRNNKDAEEAQKIVNKYYQIPSISIKDKVNKMIYSGIKWEELYADVVHPNNKGHELIANTIFRELASISFQEIIRKPLTENKYEKTKIWFSDEIIIKQLDGYKLVYDSPRFKKAYRSVSDSSMIKFECEGKYLGILFLKNSSSKKILVKIDGKEFTIPTYHPNDRGYQSVYNFGKLNNRLHTIEIINIGNFEFNAIMNYNITEN